MAVQPHDVVLPERMAGTALAAIEDSVVLPNLMQRESIDQFKGAANGAVNVKVEGVLPYREYGWRNDRSNAIQFDAYAERTMTVTFGGDVYSAVQLVDEQATMDAIGWDRLAVKQGEAVGRGIERRAIAAITGESYDVAAGFDAANPRAGLIHLRRIANGCKIPGARRLVMGPDFEQALLSDPDLTIASSVGDARAAQAVADATLGRLFGFDLIVSNDVPAETAYIMFENGFVCASGAPVSPASVKNVANASSPNGFATRWLTDYDANYLTDRSVVNTYVGFRAVKDPVLTYDENSQAQISETEYLLRAVEVSLGDENTVTLADETLEAFVGLTSTVVTP